MEVLKTTSPVEHPSAPIAVPVKILPSSNASTANPATLSPVLLTRHAGEKKRNEIFQMAMLEPKLAILDETDSGLDIDALRIVANGVNKLRSTDNAIIIITHYQRLLDHIKPDFVHVLMNGKIIRSGGPELALELEKKGYEGFN